MSTQVYVLVIGNTGKPIAKTLAGSVVEAAGRFFNKRFELTLGGWDINHCIVQEYGNGDHPNVTTLPSV
jgi:hypothetical protein